MNRFDQWRIKINTSKTTAVRFGRKHAKKITPSEIEGENITWSTEAKYPGVTINRRLKVQHAY